MVPFALILTPLYSKTFAPSKRRPFTKNDLINTLHRYQACRENDKRQFLQTATIPNHRKGLMSSGMNFNTNEAFFTGRNTPSQTFGSLLAGSRQERRLQKHEKTQKIWETESKALTKKCKRTGTASSLIERSDQYAVKLQELDQLERYSRLYGNQAASGSTGKRYEVVFLGINSNCV